MNALIIKVFEDYDTPSQSVGRVVLTQQDAPRRRDGKKIHAEVWTPETGHFEYDLPSATYFRLGRPWPPDLFSLGDMLTSIFRTAYNRRPDAH